MLLLIYSFGTLIYYRTIEGRRLEDGNEGLDEKRKRSAERSALSKRKKVDP